MKMDHYVRVEERDVCEGKGYLKYQKQNLNFQKTQQRDIQTAL